jgi:FAD/FMN-containing dehydrogenase
MISEAALSQFRAMLRGPLLLPGEPGYDAARTIHNATIDRRPAMIARCVSAADVIACVRFARERDLLVSVRGGGHSIAGKAVCDGGLMIDLSGMKGIRVDPAQRTVRAEPGLLLAEFDRETQAFGLATTMGVISRTGIAGLTLGGGTGWLARKYGLACDNVVSADVVTADGRLLTASANENEDLFWGVRGGNGNFGVVTSLEYRLHEVGPVLGGGVLYPVAMTREVLRFYRELTASCPDELSTQVMTITYNFSIWANWLDPTDSQENIQWTHDFWDAMRPFMGAGAYVNYLEDEGDPRGREAYGPNYDRLAALKNQYDPTNFFRMNHNIKPTQAAPAAMSA